MTQEPPLKVMFLNPIGNDSVNDDFAALVRSYKDADTHVTVASLNATAGQKGGFWRPATETLINAEIIRAAYQARREKYDALVINIYRDAVLNIARQLAGDMVVVGPCQSSTETALRLANRYSIIINNELYREPIERALRYYGPEYKPVSFRYVNRTFATDPASLEEELRVEAKRAVECDGAEVVILGCTVALGVYRRIQREVGVPVIDAGIAALKAAELGAQMKRRCGWGTSNKGAMESPTDEELKELQFLQEPYVYSGRIEIE